jgi:SPP1 gp7 family putative phage head morphogenesis protein
MARLTPEERAIAEILGQQIQAVSEGASEDELVRILQSLDADALDRLLRTISRSIPRDDLTNAILNALSKGGRDAVRQMRRLGDSLQLPAFRPQAVPVINAPAFIPLPTSTQIPSWALPNPTTINFGIRFDATDPNAQKWADFRAGELISSIDGQTRTVVRRIVADGLRQGRDTRTIARQIRSVVGLHPRWANAVVKFEDNEFRKLIRQGMSEERARRTAIERTARYRDRLVRKRAEMIARTENAIAQNQGRVEGWRQADQAGLVDPSSYKMWITAGDERTCDICAPMDGEIVPWTGTFSNGMERPIVHPNCRCKVVLVPPDRGLKDEYAGFGLLTSGQRI